MHAQHDSAVTRAVPFTVVPFAPGDLAHFSDSTIEIQNHGPGSCTYACGTLAVTRLIISASQENHLFKLARFPKEAFLVLNNIIEENLYSI
jgi:hypothetical protein